MEMAWKAEGMEKKVARREAVDAFAASMKWFALARRKELGWGEQGSCIGNLTGWCGCSSDGKYEAIKHDVCVNIIAETHALDKRKGDDVKYLDNPFDGRGESCSNCGETGAVVRQRRVGEQLEEIRGINVSRPPI